jgi:general nucleoside transport system permease protein
MMTDQAISGSRPAGALLPALARRAEPVVIPLLALVAGLAAFGVFLMSQGASPAQFFSLVWQGGFGSAFSWQNTLSRTAPLLFAALCVALPARLGLVVIGGEGAIVLGGVAAGALGAALSGASPAVALPLMAAGAMMTGAVWIGAAGALRHWRGVNETISSLLLAYIAIALMNHLVEGPLRDPASLNKPSTAPLPPALRIGNIRGFDVHWGLAFGVLACIASWVLIDRTTWGFAARIAGGNVRAAQVQGLPVGRLILGFTGLPGPSRALRASSRSAPSTARPTARSPRATATRASSSPSSPGTTRSSSSRSPSCSQGSRPRRASSSGAWGCPTPRSS